MSRPRSIPLAIVLAALTLCLLPAPAARADGKVFRWAEARGQTDIPDQRALIHFADGRERLVIETGFRAPGTELAWVVPLPSRPEVTAVSPGTMVTVQSLFTTRVSRGGTRWWAWSILLASIVAALIASGRVRLLPSALVLLIVGGFLISLMLPGLGKVGSAAPEPTGGVTILDRREVGAYETTTIASSEPRALLDWLGRNGFEAPESIAPVVADYVAEGWVFVATRLKRAADPGATANTHPLCFTFATDRAVYPMRLTGVDNGPVRVDLYVFGEGRAETDGLQVTHNLAVFPTASGYSSLSEGEVLRWGDVEIAHEGLSALVGDAGHATRLSGTLSPEQMRRDLFLRWKPFRFERPSAYSKVAAERFGLNATIPPLMLAWLVLALLAGAWSAPEKKARLRSRTALRAAAVLLVVAVAGAYAIAAALPQREATSSGGRAAQQMEAAHFEVWRNIYWSSAREDGVEPGPDALETLRERLATRWAELAEAGPGRIENPYFGGPIREQDSPGNYTLEVRNGRVEYAFHGAVGGRHVLR